MFRVIISIIAIFQLSKFGHPEIIDLDLCQYETFQPVCQNGEVIVIESAKYGRMDIGKCVELDEKHSDDPSWIGCSADVTDVLRRKCSARSECGVPVKDKDLEVKERPCYKGLLTYLNVKYQCMTVLSPFDRCNLQAKPEKSSFLISFASALNRADYCGSKERPWTLEAHTGQKISITSRLIASQLLFDSYESCPSSHNAQVKIGFLVDKSERNSEEFCLDRKWEISSYYESKSSLVELILTKPIRSNESFVMIEMAASGCLDLIPAEDAWLKRNEDTATIGCYASRQTWQLRCVGNQWLGVVGNCSMGKLQNQISENNPNQEDRGENGQVLALAAICGFGLVVCMLIVCCGIYCVRRISKGYKKSLDNFHCYGQVASRQPPLVNGIHQILSDDKVHYSMFKNQNILNSDQDSAYFVLDREEKKVPN